jgi:hypothetical protein
MFEKFTSADARDFATRYQGTYGFLLRPNKPKLLVKLAHVDDIVKFTDANDIGYELNPDLEDDIGFEFVPPRPGFTNTDSGAMYVERMAQRQFSRGISDRNTKVYVITEKLGFDTRRVDFKNLAQIFNSTWTKEAAWARFTAGQIPSYAISTQFAMNREKLFILGTFCGKVLNVTKEKVTVKLDDPVLFKTEINDNFRGIAAVEFQ